MKYLAVLLIGFALAFTGCNESKKINQAVYDTAVGLNAAAYSIAEFHARGLIADADYREIVKAELEVTKAHKQLVESLGQVAVLDPTNKGAILVFIDSLAQRVSDLNAVGALHIKSDNAKAAFAAGLLTTRTAIATVRAFVAAIDKPVAVKGGK